MVIFSPTQDSFMNDMLLIHLHDNQTIIRYTFMIPHVHGELTDPEINIFNRERVFIDTILKPLIQKFPRLKTVMKHVTTIDAVKFVESYDKGHVAITVTSQHFLNRKSIFQQGLKQQLLPSDTDAKIQRFVRENMAFMSILDNRLVRLLELFTIISQMGVNGENIGKIWRKETHVLEHITCAPWLPIVLLGSKTNRGYGGEGRGRYFCRDDYFADLKVNARLKEAIRIAADVDPEVNHLSGMANTTKEGLFSSLTYFFSENGIHVCDYQFALQCQTTKSEADDNEWIFYQCNSFKDNDKNLGFMLEACGSKLSADDMAPAYMEAGHDLLKACEILGSGGESFWEEGDDFRVDVLRFHTCQTDILGFLEKLEWWFEQEIDDEGEEDEEGEGGSEV
ncbi:dihydroorotase, mitochondrial-like protein isoform X2 [Tanacetum coccineum]|uniref:Dihydroorotase, mitochondrial-like protein isoform X2 n=1 Tax=Tanacetum coccineum TaxID=301880 RepID=A0ABQ5I6Z3_9ASTR